MVPARELQRPTRQHLFVHAFEAFDDHIVRKALGKPSCHQFILETITAHRPARQGRFDPSGGVCPIIQIPECSQTGNDLLDVGR